VPPLSSTVTVLDGSKLGVDTWAEPGDTASGGQGQTVDGIACGAAGITYHVHAHLTIIKDGVQLAMPNAIGRPSAGCNYALHTHDNSGVIHVESPGVQTFTLGQLFDIWGRDLSNAQVAEFASPTIAVFINDKNDPAGPRQYSGDIRLVEFGDLREITIQIGSALTELPTYDWSVIEP
jgi:hypothetical protein